MLLGVIDKPLQDVGRHGLAEVFGHDGWWGCGMMGEGRKVCKMLVCGERGTREEGDLSPPLYSDEASDRRAGAVAGGKHDGGEETAVWYSGEQEFNTNQN